MTDEKLAVCLRQRKAGDGVSGRTHRGRLRRAAAEQAGRHAGIKLKQAREHIGRDQSGRAHDQGKQHRFDAIFLQSLKELRTDRVAVGKKEQHEKSPAEIAAGIDVQIADQQAGHQRSGNRAEAEISDLVIADPIADSHREKHHDLGIGAQ